jgi:hypothetical protein
MSLPQSGTSSDCVRVGDRIYLEDDAARIVGGSGIGSDVQVVAAEKHLLPTDFGAAAVFVVHPQGTWTSLEACRALLEREGLSWLDALGHTETSSAHLEVERERQLNASDFTHALGRELRYGMVIQLKHDASKKWFSTSRQPPVVSGRVGNRVLLDEHAGDAACFRVVPKLRVHNDGEKVRASDPFVLQDLRSGQRIVLGHPLNTNGLAPTSAKNLPCEIYSMPADIGASLGVKARIYRAADDERSGVNKLHCGRAVTLFHKEVDRYLRSEAPVTEGTPLTLRSGKSDSTSIWQACCRLAPLSSQP